MLLYIYIILLCFFNHVCSIFSSLPQDTVPLAPSNGTTRPGQVAAALQRSQTSDRFFGGTKINPPKPQETPQLSFRMFFS